MQSNSIIAYCNLPIICWNFGHEIHLEYKCEISFAVRSLFWSDNWAISHRCHQAASLKCMHSCQQSKWVRTVCQELHYGIGCLIRWELGSCPSSLVSQHSGPRLDLRFSRGYCESGPQSGDQMEWPSDNAISLGMTLLNLAGWRGPNSPALLVWQLLGQTLEKPIRCWTDKMLHVITLLRKKVLPSTFFVTNRGLWSVPWSTK